MVSNRRLLQERMGSIPASMRMSDQQWDALWGSFTNIFKAGWSSIKLVGQNVLFNARMAIAAMDGDRAKMQKAFDEYATARKQFAKEADRNLKYYREAFYDKVEDEHGHPTGEYELKTGAALLIGIANPLLLPAAAWQPGRGWRDADKKAEADKRAAVDKKAAADKAAATVTAGAASDRLTRAIDFFGFGRQLSEAANPPAAALPPGAVKERERLLQIADSFVGDEELRGAKILDGLSKRVLFFKRIVESDTIEKFQEALAGAQSLGIKPVTAGLSSSRDKIEKDAKDQREKDPEAFKKFIDGARNTYPDLDPKDDIKAFLELSFRSSKSQIQEQLMQSYTALLDSAMKAMNLPLAHDTETELRKTPVGNRYLKFLQGFQRQLETGKREIESTKKV